MSVMNVVNLLGLVNIYDAIMFPHTRPMNSNVISASKYVETLCIYRNTWQECMGLLKAFLATCVLKYVQARLGCITTRNTCMNLRGVFVTNVEKNSEINGWGRNMWGGLMIKSDQRKWKIRWWSTNIPMLKPQYFWNRSYNCTV